MREQLKPTSSRSRRRAAGVGVAACLALTMLATVASADGTTELALGSTDVQERQAVVNDFAADLLPALEGHSDYAGVFVESSGAIVVLYRGEPAGLEAVIGVVEGGAEYKLELRPAEFTESELITEARRLLARWEALGLPQHSSISIDVAAQNVRIGVEAHLLERASRFADAERVSVPIALGVEARAGDAVCTSRSNCYSPSRPGIVIRKGSWASGSSCTMGFHVKVGSDEQFVTAGHCGWSGSNSWYTGGYGYMGGEQFSTYGSGYDGMRVQMPDSQASSKPYAASASVTSVRPPIQGESVCVSLGITGWNSCTGTVSTTWISWTSSTCNCTQYGADINGVSISNGDSGSPIWSGSSALGIISTTSGRFARMYDLDYGLGFQIYS